MPNPFIHLATLAVCAIAPACVVGEETEDTYEQTASLDLYDGCSSSAQCYESDCWDVTVEYEDGFVTDAMCTYQCDFDQDCDYGGLCLQVSAEEPLCYARCVDDLDCPLGFACVTDTFGYDPVCLPW